MKLIHAFLAVVLLIFCFTTGAWAQNINHRETIIYSYLSNVGPLNPHMYSPSQMFAQSMVYDPLVRLNPDAGIGPALAERWAISEDGLVYTFFLRQDVRFSDGQIFNAEAVVKNFKTIMGNARRHEWLGIINKIESFEAAGPYEFKLTLKTPYYPCLEDLSLPRPFRMLSPAAFPDDGDTSKGIKAPVGTGPWKLVKIALGEYDLFERNEFYWGERPKVSSVLIKVIPDPVSRALAFETGETDLIYGLGQINFDAFDRLRQTPAVSAEISNPMGTMAAALNTAKGPTAELRVRKAIQHLTDKAALIKGVTLDTQPRAETLFAPGAPYCDLNLPAYEYDLAQAAALLDEAGWLLPAGQKIREKGGQPLRLDFCFIGNNAAHKALAEVLQAQAGRVGLALNLIGEEEDSFYRRQKAGDFHLILNPTWGPPFEPHAFIASMLLPSHADFMAQSGLTMKADIDVKINEVLSTTDEAVRSELYREILTVLHEQAVYLPIFHDALFLVHRPDRLENARFGAGRSHIPFEEFSVR